MRPLGDAGRGLDRAVPARVVVVALLVLCVASGCSSSHASAHAGTAVQVTERDFHITASPTHVPSGEVVLTVTNHGPDAHELIVVRAEPKSLPLRTDGITINEEALQKSTAGSLEPGQPGAVRQLRLHLKPGRYELFCNMFGHFLGGMHTDLVVT